MSEHRTQAEIDLDKCQTIGRSIADRFEETNPTQAQKDLFTDFGKWCKAYGVMQEAILQVGMHRLLNSED